MARICFDLYFLDLYFLQKSKQTAKVYCEQQCVRDECVKLSDYLQRFRVRLYDAFQKLRATDVADIHLLSSWNVHCKLMFYGLMNEFQSNGDVLKFVVDFAAD